MQTLALLYLLPIAGFLILVALLFAAAWPRRDTWTTEDRNQ